MTKRKKKRKSSSAPVVSIVLIAIAVVCIAFIVTNVLGENDTAADQNSLFNLTSAEDAAVIVDHEQLEVNGKHFGDSLYIPYKSVWDEINSAFYVEEASDTLYMTLPAQTLTWTAGDESGYLYKDADGTYYISSECIAQYSDIELRTYEEPYRIVINTDFSDKNYVSAVRESAVRTEPSAKSEIVYTCSEGDTFELLSQEGDWSLVFTQDGHTGYIRAEYVTAAEAPSEHLQNEELVFERITIDESVKMVWDYIGRAEDNAELDRMMEGVSGLNVISPTWFTIADTTGGLASFADASYVETAHNTYGLEVWALVGDYGGDDSSTGEILQTYENRQRIITQLIESALTCGFDGINIDFENIREEFAPAYIEFLRELTQQAHMNSLVVSVDNYVPGYTDHYRRDAQNDIADYVIMMGYDEHTAYTSEYGSVASLTYVEEGITATLEEVDADKLVLGVPFYSRGWTVPFGSEVFETETLFMSAQEEFMSAHGIEELTWDASVGQYVGSSEDSSNRYYVWIENAQSLEVKLGLVNKYSLAGASGWRLGMQTDDIWAVWSEYLG